MNEFKGICKINLSIDDVNPKSGWRIIGEPTQKYLEKLNNDFGVRVTLFIPANHHSNARLTENKSWIQELDSLNFIEFGAHGYYHNTKDPTKWGECEFGELTDSHEILSRINYILNEWNNCDLHPKIWKSPGWLTSRESARQLSQWFHYAVIHPVHNHNLMWKCNTITAADFAGTGIPHMDNNMFILSHIHGRHDNVWNENFYNHVHRTLELVTQNISTEMSFIKDL